MTDDLWIKPDNDELGEPSMDRGPSRIIFNITSGSSHFTATLDAPNRLEIDNISFDGGDAAWAHYDGSLEDVVREALWRAGPPPPLGWYVIPDFELSYTKSYEGEVDSVWHFGDTRPATWRDYADIVGPVPWWALPLTWVRWPMRTWRGP